MLSKAPFIDLETITVPSSVNIKFLIDQLSPIFRISAVLVFQLLKPFMGLGNEDSEDMSRVL